MNLYYCNGCDESARLIVSISHKPGCLVAAQEAGQETPPSPVPKPISAAIREILNAWNGPNDDTCVDNLVDKLTRLFNDRTPIPPVHRPIAGPYYFPLEGQTVEAWQKGGGLVYCFGCGRAARASANRYGPEKPKDFRHEPDCVVYLDEQARNREKDQEAQKETPARLPIAIRYFSNGGVTQCSGCGASREHSGDGYRNFPHKPGCGVEIEEREEREPREANAQR
jgi:hypothetical protein